VEAVLAAVTAFIQDHRVALLDHWAGVMDSLDGKDQWLAAMLGPDTERKPPAPTDRRSKPRGQDEPPCAHGYSSLLTAGFSVALW
jgi:hypothetical protein